MSNSERFQTAIRNSYETHAPQWEQSLLNQGHFEFACQEEGASCTIRETWQLLLVKEQGGVNVEEIL